MKPGQPDEARLVVNELRAAAWAREISDLMGRRPELAGVYGPADLAAEAIRWCA